MSSHKAEKALMELYLEVYKVTEPPLDFSAVLARVKDGEKMENNWFLLHKIDKDVENNLLKAICKKHKLNQYWTRAVEINYYLGCSPTSEGRNE
jgi:hypothetical protein